MENSLEELELPAVSNAPSGNKNRMAAFAFLGIGTICLLGLGYYFWPSRSKPAASASGDISIATNVTRSFDLPAQKPRSEPAPFPPAVTPPTVSAPPVTTSLLPGIQKSQVVLDKSSSDVMVKTQEGAGPQAASNNQPTQKKEVNAEAGSMGALLTSTSTPKKLATSLGDRNFTLAKGSVIQCALETTLDSTLPGMTSCIVTYNVYGDNGKVVLIERGSVITGEYRSDLKQGSERLFVLWNRVKTPNGVVIDLDSPAVDDLGASGAPGYVDTHFFERFGSAMLMSLFSTGEAMGQQVIVNRLNPKGSTSNGGTSVTLNTAPTDSIVTETLKQSINIPPTLSKNQGERIGVYVARDLDFSSVYKLSPDNGGER